MKCFSISEVECLTGIKAGTIRIWEQRYSLIKPKRTDTNIRFYDDQDLKRLLNVSVLCTHGYKISNIALMTEDQICSKVNELTETTAANCCIANGLSDAMVKMDARAVECILNTSILKSGFEATFIHVVIPFLKKTSSLWQTGAINPAQEHFIVNLIKQKVMSAIDGLPYKEDQLSSKFLLFLPEGERYEIPLLFAHYLLKARGHQVLYLGANMPLRELGNVVDYYRPDYAITILTSHIEGNIETYLRRITAPLRGVRLLLAGYQVMSKLEPSEEYTIIASAAEFLQWIADQVPHGEPATFA